MDYSRGLRKGATRALSALHAGSVHKGFRVSAGAPHGSMRPL